MATIARPPVYRITAVQMAVLFALWALLSGWNPTVATSVGLGGLVAIVPHAWFARGVFRWRGAGQVRRAAQASYAAEIGKFLLSVAGFALVFATIRPIEGWAVFAGYSAMLAVQISGAWWLLRHSVVGQAWRPDE